MCAAPLSGPTQLAAGAVPRISVVIVNYNGGKCVGTAVQSVFDSIGAAITEVIVVDNASTDGSPAAIAELARHESRVRLLENPANLGFAAANNCALPLLNIDSEFLLFLNPDCVVEPHTMSRMLMVMQAHPEAGMAGCLIANLDGSEQRGDRRNIPTPVSALVRVLWLDRMFPTRFHGFDLAGTHLPEQPVEVEAISGAFMLVRRCALDAVGPLDAGYFLHCEDLDWCKRFRMAGWKILFVPGARVAHAQGASSRTAPVSVEYHKHKGMLRFYRKFYSSRYPLPMLWLVTLGVWLRFLVVAARLTLVGRSGEQR
jgi:GT2 family glycosyltransferase